MSFIFFFVSILSRVLKRASVLATTTLNASSSESSAAVVGASFTSFSTPHSSIEECHSLSVEVFLGLLHCSHGGRGFSFIIFRYVEALCGIVGNNKKLQHHVPLPRGVVDVARRLTGLLFPFQGLFPRKLTPDNFPLALVIPSADIIFVGHHYRPVDLFASTPPP